MTTQSDDDILTLTEVIESGGCVVGIKEVCKSYNINFMEFARRGISISKLRTFNDATINLMIDRALSRRK